MYVYLGVEYTILYNKKERKKEEEFRKRTKVFGLEKSLVYNMTLTYNIRYSRQMETKRNINIYYTEEEARGAKGHWRL